MVVVGELSKREKRIPVVLSFPNEDAQVLLELLVNMLGLPISLRVIGCGQTLQPQSQVVSTAPS